MLAGKVRKWLDEVPAAPAAQGAWVDAAAKFLKEK
jgi:hypothetical protein